jgi:hypothetical protein
MYGDPSLGTGTNGGQGGAAVHPASRIPRPASRFTQYVPTFQRSNVLTFPRLRSTRWLFFHGIPVPR